MGEVTCRDCLHEWACCERSRRIPCREFYRVPRREDDGTRGQEGDSERTGSNSPDDQIMLGFGGLGIFRAAPKWGRDSHGVLSKRRAEVY